MKGGFNDSEAGFTLTEFMVAMLISLIAMSGIYATYYSQQKSFSVQSELAQMQQNLRAGMFLLETDIRMAGYDPKGSASAGIVSAGADSFEFTYDKDGDGAIDPAVGKGEAFRYELFAYGGGIGLRREKNAAEPVAENVDAVDFVYLDTNDNLTATLSEIRSVQVTMVIRTERGDRGYVNSTAFRNQQGTVIYTAPGDSFRRECLTTQIKCRNLGLI